MWRAGTVGQRRARARGRGVADAWIFELKHDGFRALARSGTRVQILSRWGRSMTAQSPETAAALARLPDAVLDGELVVPTAKGRSDFEELTAPELAAVPAHDRRSCG